MYYLIKFGSEKRDNLVIVTSIMNYEDTRFNKRANIVKVIKSWYEFSNDDTLNFSDKEIIASNSNLDVLMETALLEVL